MVLLNCGGDLMLKYKGRNDKKKTFQFLLSHGDTCGARIKAFTGPSLHYLLGICATAHFYMSFWWLRVVILCAV